MGVEILDNYKCEGQAELDFTGREDAFIVMIASPARQDAFFFMETACKSEQQAKDTCAERKMYVFCNRSTGEVIYPYRRKRFETVRQAKQYFTLNPKG